MPSGSSSGRLLPESLRGRKRLDDRRVLNGIVWKFRTGTAWRDVPERYGPWATLHTRFRRWAADGRFDRMLRAAQAKADAAGDIEWLVSVESTVVRAHQRAARGSKRGLRDPALGWPRGGRHLATRLPPRPGALRRTQRRLRPRPVVRRRGGTGYGPRRQQFGQAHYRPAGRRLPGHPHLRPVTASHSAVGEAGVRRTCRTAARRCLRLLIAVSPFVLTWMSCIPTGRSAYAVTSDERTW
ncbi:transposase [Streptomyces griseoincarnatus]